MTRYMFASPTSAKLQEIGPRFTLKLRWLRKGLPSVTAPDGSVPRGGDPLAAEHDATGQTDSIKDSGAEAAIQVPPLDEEQEYEWKWKVRRGLLDKDATDLQPKMEVSRRTFFL